MVLLVRDEEDIVYENLAFHLEMGVDHIIATDNGSDDRTRDILAAFERLGVMTLIDEPGRDHSQWRWVSRMAQIARDVFDAAWIIPNDADEFWLPTAGSYRAALENFRADALKCHRFNMVGDYSDSDQAPWYETVRYRIAKPLEAPVPINYLNETIDHPHFYRALDGKVLVKARHLKYMREGNHSAVFDREVIQQETDRVVVYHFPVRSRSQFESKITNTAVSYSQNTELPTNIGWHQRRWYHLLKSRGLEESFHAAVPTEEQFNKDVASGILIEDRGISRILGKLPSRISEFT